VTAEHHDGERPPLTGGPSRVPHRRRQMALLAVLVAAIVAVLIGLGLVWTHPLPDVDPGITCSDLTALRPDLAERARQALGC
jgi:hypothetical protein